MAATHPPWRLVSVLFSSLPLSPSLAMTLYQAACDVHRRGAGAGEVAGDVVSGRVVDLRREVLLGTLSGPAFEAKIETERGAGIVRFLVTREGLEGEHRPALPN